MLKEGIVRKYHVQTEEEPKIKLGVYRDDKELREQNSRSAK